MTRGDVERVGGGAGKNPRSPKPETPRTNKEDCPVKRCGEQRCGSADLEPKPNLDVARVRQPQISRDKKRHARQAKDRHGLHPSVPHTRLRERLRQTSMS